MPKIKGTHNAMKSAMLAAESIWETLDKGESTAETIEPVSYEEALKSSWVYDELREVRYDYVLLLQNFSLISLTNTFICR